MTLGNGNGFVNGPSTGRGGDEGTYPISSLQTASISENFFVAFSGFLPESTMNRLSSEIGWFRSSIFSEDFMKFNEKMVSER